MNPVTTRAEIFETFGADILYRDIDLDSWVFVENQLDVPTVMLHELRQAVAENTV